MEDEQSAAAAAIEKFRHEDNARIVIWFARYHDRRTWHNPRLWIYGVLDAARANRV